MMQKLSKQELRKCLKDKIIIVNLVFAGIKYIAHEVLKTLKDELPEVFS